MRVLFTTQAQSSHFDPLVPLARALEASGHEVAFAAAASFAPRISAAGFRSFPAGIDDVQAREALPALRDLSGIPYRDYMREHVFLRLWPERMLDDLLETAVVWPPDLVVRDASEFAGAVAAEHWGIPHAGMVIGRGVWSYAKRHASAPYMDRLRARVGLPPDPDGAMLFRYLHLIGCPPSLQDPGMEPAPTAHFIRRVIFDQSGDETLPSWVTDLPPQPTVYATLGTVFNEQPTIFTAIIAAFRDESANLIVTVGRNMDPALLGPHAVNVHVERYIPQSLLMPRCDVVVCQAGFGTIMGALEHGIPVVNIPISADQPENAARCADLGIGVTVGPGERTPATIRSAVSAVLADPAYRTKASQVRNEIMGLPGVEYAAQLLERLAIDRKPIVASP